ncbi:ATP-binding cassette domain-containing protein [Leisingera daeponensis]|uniref:ATP-binding cassette domain-containing protein n=1 Tax=Leisingera daeponensis TaxID=405746 RepID=A0ABS7NJB1_9RHOB|nr:ATP-binding cassette domain-containing protein [Leisingera daeponensis]MBY6141295.1 ATP-binding cassette domain-containing protein [Leisingera daeponensis]
MLEINNLNVSIGPVPILRGSALTVNTGEMVGLIGPNGAGKTTMMRAIMGLLAAQSGTMSFDHYQLPATPPQDRARIGIGYMPEDRKLVPQLSAEENIMMPVWAVDIPDYHDRLKWIYDLMPEVREFRGRSATSLSGGQQKLAALARALMMGGRLILLDEPSEGIAPVLARRISEILRDLKSEGMSILIAESNDHHCADLLDRSYRIERGATHPA